MLSIRECKKRRYVIIPRTQIRRDARWGVDLGLQRIAKGLGPCTVEGEFRLVLLLLGFSPLATSSFSEGCMAAAHCILEYKDRLLSHKQRRMNPPLLLARSTDS